MKINVKNVTVQPRTLHLLQSPCGCVNLVKRESAPRRRRLGMGSIRNREAAGLTAAKKMLRARMICTIINNIMQIQKERKMLY